jgi:hypothetical protein
MSDEKRHSATAAPRVADPELAAFLDLAAKLGPGDAAALAGVVRRTADIYEDDGEAVALAVLEQIEGILNGRRTDA